MADIDQDEKIPAQCPIIELSGIPFAAIQAQDFDDHNPYPEGTSEHNRWEDFC